MENPYYSWVKEKHIKYPISLFGKEDFSKKAEI